MNDNRFQLSRYKSLIIVLLIGLTSKVSAQSILQSEIGSGFGILETLNQLLLFPLTTYQDLGIFIAIWAGFYYATKPILNQLMTGMLEVFPSLGDSSDSILSSGSSSSDMVNRSVRGLSLVSGFVAAQYIGWAIGGLMLIIIGSASLIAIAAYMVWGTKGFMGELSGNSAGSGGGTSTDGGVTTDQVSQQVNQQMGQQMGQMKDELMDEMQKSKTIEQKFNELKHSDFEKAAKQLINDDRLPEGVRNEMKSLAQEFEDEKGKEMTLLEVIEDIVSREEGELQELHEVDQIRQWSDDELGQILQEEKRVENLAQKLESQLNDLSQQQDQLFERLREAEQQGNTQAVEQVRQEIGQVQGSIRNLEDQIHQGKTVVRQISDEFGGLDSRLSSAEEEIEDVKKKESATDEEISKAEKEDEEVKKEAEDEEKKIDEEEAWFQKHEHDKREEEMIEEIHQDIDREMEIAREEDSLEKEAEDEEKKIEGYTKEEEQAIMQDLKGDKEAKKRAANIQQQFEWLEQQAQERLQKGQDATGQSGQFEEAEVQREKQVDQKLGEVVQELEKIDQQAAQLHDNQIVGKVSQQMNVMQQLVQQLPAPENTPPQQRQQVESLQSEAYQIMADLYQTIEQRGGDGASKHLDQMKSFQKKFPLYGELRR